MTQVQSFSTLADMKDFLTALGTNIFDSVAYDDNTTPTKIVCTQDSHTILEVSVNGTNWTFTPYIADGTAAASGHIYTSAILSAFRCSGGAFFATTAVTNNVQANGKYFVIGKTSAGKTGFVHIQSAQGFSNISSLSPVTTCFGDDTSSAFYSGTYHISITSGTRDRTILTKIPVTGALGSNDYFSSVLVMTSRQFQEVGQQSIGAQLYGCNGYFAITDTAEAS